MDWYLLFFDFKITLIISILCLFYFYFFLRLEEVQTPQMHLESKYLAHRVPITLTRLQVTLLNSLKPGEEHYKRARSCLLHENSIYISFPYI